MKNKLFLSALGALLYAGTAFAQVNTYNAFPIPEGSKATSINISGNGQYAIVGTSTKDGVVKYLIFKKSNGSYVPSTDANPLNDLISQNVMPMNPSQNNDGSKIYFASQGSGSTDIFMIEKRNGKWGTHTALGDSINTERNEQYPAISPDGNTLYFTRLNDGMQDSRCGTLFMSSRKADGSWSKAKDAPEPITLGCEAAPYVCPDNKTIYMSSMRDGGKGGFDIYYTQRSGEKSWVIPISIDTVNTQGDEMSAVWDYEGKQMYFLGRDQKKKDALNKADIADNYKHTPVSRYTGKTIDMTTGKPLGANIEVKDAFSSIILAQHKSDDVTGVYDFFLSGNPQLFIDYNYPGYSHSIVETVPNGQENKQDYQLFSKVSLQLNVFDSEMFEALSSNIDIKADGQKADIKLNEFAKGRYKMDLAIGKNYDFHIDKDLYKGYDFNLDLSQVVIFDSFERDAELISQKCKVDFIVTGLEPGATADIDIVDLSTATRYSTTITTGPDGKASINLRKDDNYQFSIIKKGYSMFTLTKVLTQPENTITAQITKLQENVKIEIPNVNFATASAVLDPSSYESLNNVVSLLKMNSDITIELSAHTDNVGQKAYNLKLSDQRAASVAAYLINKGIAKSRIVSKGYGMDQPIADNSTEEGRAQNRRVELKIIGTVANH